MQLVLQQRRSDGRQALSLVAVLSLAVHGVVFFAIGAYLCWTELGKHDDAGGPKRPEELVVRMALPPAVAAPPVVEEIEKPREKPMQSQPKGRSFMRTDPSLAREEAPDRVDFESDKNTVAASESAPSKDPEALPLPSQRGEIFERVPSLVDSAFQEDRTGESGLPMIENTNLPAPRPRLPEKKPMPEPPEKVSKPDEESQPPLPRPDSLARPGKPLDLRGPDAKPLLESLPKLPPEKPKENKPSEESEKLERSKLREQKRTSSNSPKSGRKLQSYASEQRRSQISGSISRHGKSSINARNTPLGRYWQQILKSVEIEWQRQATKHRDFNMPGSLRVAFYVDPRGKVTDLRILSAAGVATIQRGYTMKSIRVADIPPMPRDLLEEMHGEPVEMEITFNY